jgi:hypothetical protein
MTRTAFVTRTSAARVTSIPAQCIARVECWANVVLVVFVKGLGLRPRFVSYRAFQADAVQFRTAGAAKLPGTVTDKGGDIYEVQGSKGDTYTVDFAVSSCNCEDNRRRGAVLSCKHIRKVTGYIESRRAAVALAESKKPVITFAELEQAIKAQTADLKDAVEAQKANVASRFATRPDYTEAEKIAFASCGW